MVATNDTLLAVSTFATLQDMRAQSKTGAALGSISEKELDLLGAANGSLALSQSKEQYLDNLYKYKALIYRVIHGKANPDSERPELDTYWTGILADIQVPQSQPQQTQVQPQQTQVEPQATQVQPKKRRTARGNQGTTGQSFSAGAASYFGGE